MLVYTIYTHFRLRVNNNDMTIVSKTLILTSPPNSGVIYLTIQVEQNPKYQK